MYKKILLTSTIFAVMPFTALSFYQPSALPVITSTPITNTNEDAPYAYAAAAFDTDAADTLSWAVKSGETLPGWLALSNGSISTTDVGGPITGPGGVAMDAAGNIYVAGLSGTTIFKITPDGTQTSFATVASSSKYGMLVIGSTLYVSYYNLNKITKIDLNNPSAGESDWINPIRDPLAMLEKDGFLYVAQYSANKVSKIDLSDDSVTDVVTGTPYPFGIGFSKDGTLYIASYNNKYISSFKDDVLSANIKSFGSSLSDIKIDNNDNIYVSSFGSGVKRIPPDLSTTIDISTTGRVWGMSLAPSGALIWGINDANKVVKLETGTILSGTPTNDDVGDHDICLTVTDATNNVDQCFTLTVNNVNDAPVAANNTGLSLDEGAAGTIGQTELEFSDVDATDTPSNLTYTLTTVPIYGSLKLNSNTLALNGTFSQQDINSALISYQHDDSDNLSDSFGFSFADGLEDGITAITGQTFTFTLNNVNDNPTVNNTPSELMLSEDTNGQIDLSGMTLADTDSASITLTLTMSGGVFTAPADGSSIGSGVTATLVNATVITLTGSVADINAYLDSTANIQYTGVNNASGDNAASLTLSANDGTADVTLGNVNVNISPVNDAPTGIVLSSLSVNQSSLISSAATVGLLTTTDVDSTDIHSYTLVTPNSSDNNTCSTSADNALFEIDVDALKAKVGTNPGVYAVCIQTTDSLLSAENDFNITVVDDVAPDEVVITTPIEGDGRINANEDNDVLIQGSGAEPNATVNINMGGIEIQVSSDENGDWSILNNELDISALDNGELTLTVTQTDAAGNISSAATQTVVLDNQTPADFSVDVSQDLIDTSNETGASFSLVGAELNSTYTYTITDENNQTVTGSGSVTSANQLIDSIDITILAEGRLTLSVILSDPANNQTLAFSDTTEKRYQKPPVIAQGAAVSVTMSEDNAPQAFVLSLDATDDNQDDLTWSIVTQATNGEASVSGNDNSVNVSYSPKANHNGVDSFSIQVTDGLETDSIQVNVIIAAVNDQPILQGDNFVFAKNTNNSYSLDVLANDTDVDGDTLIIEGVNASIGDVSVDNGIVVYQAPENYVGNVTLNYSVRDGQKGRAQASAQLEITGVQEGQPPVITLPSDVEVNATGLFTKIDLGVATAVDALGNPLSVSLVDGITFFKPGNNIAYWQAIDNAGNQTIAEQKVVVHPLISIAKDQVVAEGSTVTVRVLLNGMAPQYPLDIPFSVSGSALADTDYTLAQGNLVITSGTQAELVFAVLSDDEVETDETVIVSLNSNFNLGAKNSSTIRISEANIAPSINLLVRQNDENRFTVSQVDGLVRIQAQVSDPNPNDQLTNVWAADQAFVNTSSDALIFEFDPSALSEGVYKVTLTTTDTGLLSDSQTVYINLVNSLASLTAIDTDGDLIPDNEEGYADTDGDGIPDYLDAISECNVVPSQSMTQDSFLLEGEPGVCLRKGSVSIASESGGLLIDNGQAENDLTVDEDVTISGDIVDFIAYGLPEKGQNYRLVNPQSRPIPQNAIYRKYSQANGWFNFVEDDQNQLSSTKGERGYCPSPGDIRWSAGLTAGDWCVQLQIEDGGPNDDDGQANGAIVDPGGVAVVNQGNQLPVANNDTVALPWNMSITVDVLNNDTDADNDMLEVSSASASFGEVIVNNDNTITYTPNLNYAGNDTINYGITDGQGGSDSAQVMVTVKPNRAPVAQNDEITIDGSTTVDINVLSNDSDIDGDTLSIELATAQSGQVAVNNNRLTYTAGDFIGEDIIIYTINDGQGSQANGILTVTVTGPKAVKVNNTSSGGGSGIWSLLTLFAALLMRRQATQTPQQDKGVKS
ncbi:tandem-95 repeat protein [Colwellia sp. MB3u-70]|uniref:Ig-like domain-containing protein n=1 Tax=unclassified Colwellia TaxID=196834 RepID=UPI0015F6AD35|nr:MULTISPECIES: tandem-95 repeat protein [unclassified Colwellia]MBA6293663.1 tandem-95 repeat protein [Colwellia sp. MB3u-8]MBA6308910.1 tandem-95 repeat protein [Colwellia sp. MB3u-70]